jgi:hypothetical protein
LCVTAATLKAGTAITLAACGSVATQSWDPMTAWYQWGGGNVSGVFSDDHSVAGEPLTVGTGTPAPAETAPMVPASPAQSWLLGQTSFRPLANTNWCLTAPSAAVGQQLTVQTCDGSASQSFTWAGVPGAPAGALELRLAEAPTLCMTSSPGSATVPVTLQPCSATETTQWWTTW